MSEITILHLSDIHFKRNKDEDNKAFRKKVQERLIEAVAAHLSDHHGIDFVVITGDIAFSGKKEEYNEALMFLSDFRKVLPKEIEFLAVPGNHDVDRSKINKFFSLHQIVKEEKIDTFLESRDDVNSFINVKFTAFRESFIDHLHPDLYQNKADYYWVKNYPNKNVSFLGLNSAWASEGDHDPTKIALGFSQAVSALDKTKDITNKILLLHHPLFNFFDLKDANKWSGEIFAKCPLILHGHVHIDNALGINTPSASCISIGSNAVYTHDGFIGFQFIEAKFRGRELTIKVWPYRLEERNRLRFVPDTQRWEKQSGPFFEMSTSASPAKELKETKENTKPLSIPEA